jgi:hypothetical protein
MATLTHRRDRSARNHLTLVSTVETVEPTVRRVEDPEPGPRDADELVARFASLLPDQLDCDGAFTI